MLWATHSLTSYSPNMRSIMGFLPVVKEGPKGMSGLKVTDFPTIPIAIPIAIPKTIPTAISKLSLGFFNHELN